MRAAAIFLVLALGVGCSRAPETVTAQPPTPLVDHMARERLDAIERRLQTVEDDAAELAAIEVQEARPSRSNYELVVSWPSGGGEPYRRGYTDQQACDAARRAVFQENERREAVNQAQVGQANAAGYTVTAVGSVAQASAICIPS